MTAAVGDAPAAQAGPAAARAGLHNLLLAEWTKIRSVRSTLWSLILLVVLTIGLTGAFMAITVASWSQIRNAGRAEIWRIRQVRSSTPGCSSASSPSACWE